MEIKTFQLENVENLKIDQKYLVRTYSHQAAALKLAFTLRKGIIDF